MSEPERQFQPEPNPPPQHPILPAVNNPVNANSTYPAVPGVIGTAVPVILPDGTMPAPSSPSIGVFGAGVTGVYGMSDTGTGAGVFGQSQGFDAVVGETLSPAHAGVTGRNTTSGAKGGVGIYGVGGLYAGKFDGNVRVNGTLTATVDVVLGSDCAEDFDIVPSSHIDPGTVMVLTDSGDLQACQEPYDRRVAGVLSGAGDYEPGLILGRREVSPDRMPLALVGKVYCKADAQYGPIEVGDLLTTSPTPGHAMRAMDPLKAFGSVVGKALRRLDAGQDLIPILVALQ